MSAQLTPNQLKWVEALESGDLAWGADARAKGKGKHASHVSLLVDLNDTFGETFETIAARVREHGIE